MADNCALRLVGIDFGTSTSLIRVKRYQENAPVGDHYTTGSVTYGNGAGDSKAVTLVRKNADGTFTCGRYGEDEVPGATLYREFKMDLENPDPEKRKLARDLTKEFFCYLYERYSHQESDLGLSTDRCVTLVSYPAKWKPETRDFMEKVAKEAGFSNVSSMDEPSAALYAVLCRKMDDITGQGLLKEGQSGYMLLIDMGAGTTDLAVCSYSIRKANGTLSAVDRVQTAIVSTWPDDSSTLTFGGREVDRILEDYLVDYLKDSGLSEAMADNAIRGKPAVTSWKEDTVSNLLSQNQQVNYCSFATMYASMFGGKPFPAFGRDQFQQMLGSKLEDFRQLVTGCLNAASAKEPELKQKGIDLVVLTGGHSSWYFTSDLLDGTMPGISHDTLKKVQQEKQRVLRLTNPQETVALGMVYSRLPLQVANTPTYTLTVRYIDEDGKALCPPRVRSGIKEGSIYDSFQREFPDYNFRKVLGGEPSGIMTGNKTITYVYARKLPEFSYAKYYAQKAQENAANAGQTTQGAGEPKKQTTNNQKEQAKQPTGTAAQTRGSKQQPLSTLKQFITGYPFQNLTRLNQTESDALWRAFGITPSNPIDIYCGFNAFNGTGVPSFLTGTFFTDNGIYSKSKSRTVHCSWEQLWNGYLYQNGNALMVCNPEDHSRIQVGVFPSITDEIHDFYLELRKKLDIRFGKTTYSWLYTPMTQKDYQNVPFEAILKKTLADFDPTLIKELRRKSEVSTMRQHFCIHPQETVYLAHDDTLFHSGKTGVILTDKGIYSKDSFLPSWFTGWDQFALGSIRSEGADIFLRFPNGVRKIGVFGFGETPGMLLYFQLQKAFREAAAGTATASRPHADAKQSQTNVKQPQAASAPAQTSLEKFLSIYDWSGLKSSFSPANIPAVQKKAEPRVGRVILAYRGVEQDSGSKYVFMFALGEKGIWANPQFISWEDFANGIVSLNGPKHARILIGKDTDPVIENVSSNFTCHINDIQIPHTSGVSGAKLAKFFFELQKYMRNPAAYRVPNYTWSSAAAAGLQRYAQSHSALGCMGRYDNNSKLRELLNLPASSTPLYYLLDKPKSVFLHAVCVDQSGFRQRINKGGAVTHVPMTAFLNGELWAAEYAGRWTFYAGCHDLFSWKTSTAVARQTYQALKELQSQLRSAY